MKGIEKNAPISLVNHRYFHHPAWIEINVDQLRQNIQRVRQFIGSTRYCLPIKANAYGHGLEKVAKIAERTGIDYLAVAHLQEGITLRQAGIRLPILVLGAIHEEQIQDFLNFNLEFSISSKFKAELVSRHCHPAHAKCRVHLEVDTGMHRTGVRVSSASDLLRYLQSQSCFDVVGVYSHFATSERPGNPLVHQQLDSFLALWKDPLFEKGSFIRHIANSGGTACYPQSHLDMVRPSLLTFGYLPEGAPAELEGIRPCLMLKAKVAYFKVVEAGAGISYGHSYVAPSRTRIVTVPVGYGDGYRRALSNRGQVLIHGKKYPIVGKVCMDQFMVDVGEDAVYVGDEVVLIGSQGQEEVLLDEMATLCDTIPYEILCGFNDRLPRMYTGDLSTLFPTMVSSSASRDGFARRS